MTSSDLTARLIVALKNCVRMLDHLATDTDEAAYARTLICEAEGAAHKMKHDRTKSQESK